MKNILAIACMALLMIATSCKAQDNIQLSKPSMDNNVTLMQALQSPYSAREFDDKKVPDDVQSIVLWAACGINRPNEGKLTAPSVINVQDIQVYVIRKDGAYLYTEETSLQKVRLALCCCWPSEFCSKRTGIAGTSQQS